jgi:hypothetical protein
VASQKFVEAKMSRVPRAAAFGAVLAVVYVTWDGGAPPLSAALDPVIWLVYVFIALAGAFAGISVVLAWQHIRESPRWLWGTLVGLLLLSVPVVRPFVREARDTERFLATADSTKGVVANKYVRGAIYLVVDYEVAGEAHTIRKAGRNPYVGTPAFSQWTRGDSIWVYYQPMTPEVALVGHPGPDRRALIESLAKVWSVGGVLLTAYLPLVVRGLRRRPHPSVGTASPHAAAR